MAKASIVLYTSKKYKDGTSPIMLRVTKNKQLKYFKIGDENFNIKTKQWNKEFGLVKNDKRVNPNHEFLNTYISEKKAQAVKIINNFEEKGIAWTFNMFETEYRNKPKISKVKPFILAKIDELKKQSRFKSATGLEDTLHLLELHNASFHRLFFQDIDYKYIDSFYSYLKNERKNKDTTIGVALRGVRAILNDAITKGVGSKETYPFSNIYGAANVFRISKLERRTKKRFIPKEYMIKLVEAEIMEPHLNWAKQMFLFSFFGSGINFKDMAYLQAQHIVHTFDGKGKEVAYIEFDRRKTGEGIKLPITKHLQQIIDWAADNTTNNNEYLLPIITNLALKGEQLDKHIAGRRKRLNKHLRSLSERLKFPEGLLNITSYYARHSYATTMLRNGVQVEKISEALGHADIKTTQIYLESFGTDEIAKLNEGLLD